MGAADGAAVVGASVGAADTSRQQRRLAVPAADVMHAVSTELSLTVVVPPPTHGGSDQTCVSSKGAQ